MLQNMSRERYNICSVSKLQKNSNTTLSASSKPALSSVEIKPLIKLQSAVILPSNDINHSSIISPGEGESEKFLKGEGSMVQGQVFLKGRNVGGALALALFIFFSRFIIFAFRSYFTFCKIMLCIWRKMIFFCHRNFRKKSHSKLS